MKYTSITKGTFLLRPNRFIAHVCINGKTEICHVKNTGRCKELLTEGAAVFLEKSSNPNRKTMYDLISVYKGSRLINMDSQAPNSVAKEYIHRLYPDALLVKPEVSHGDSRFDYYIETPDKKIFMEVKGVTLEKDGHAMFPDAPTERGIKHIKNLIACISEGYEAAILFIIQMKGVHDFAPNDVTHKAFGDWLRTAKNAGVRIEAVDCIVTEDEIIADSPVKILL